MNILLNKDLNILLNKDLNILLKDIIIDNYTDHKLYIKNIDYNKIYKLNLFYSFNENLTNENLTNENLNQETYLFNIVLHKIYNILNYIIIKKNKNIITTNIVEILNEKIYLLSKNAINIIFNCNNINNDKYNIMIKDSNKLLNNIIYSLDLLIDNFKPNLSYYDNINNYINNNYNYINNFIVYNKLLIEKLNIIEGDLYESKINIFYEIKQQLFNDMLTLIIHNDKIKKQYNVLMTKNI